MRLGSGRDGAGCGDAFWAKIVAIVPPRGYPQPLESQPTPKGAPIGERPAYRVSLTGSGKDRHPEPPTLGGLFRKANPA